MSPHFHMHLRSAAIVFLWGLIAMFASPAAAQDIEAQKLSCSDETAAPDARIDACSRLLVSGLLSDQDIPIGYTNRGIAYAGKNEHDRAIHDFDDAIRSDPNYAKAFNNRGNVYNIKGQHDRAIQDFDQAIRLNPSYANAYVNRGDAYSNKHQRGRAIQDYDRAIKLDPKHALAFNNRGIAHTGEELFDRAVQDFERAISLDPKSAQAYNALAWLRATAKDVHSRNGGEAVRVSRQAIALDSKTAAYRDTLAAAYMENNQPEQALAAYWEAMQVGGEDLIRDYQNDLKKRGFYSGATDGKIVPAFDAALKACVAARCKIFVD